MYISNDTCKRHFASFSLYENLRISILYGIIKLKSKLPAHSPPAQTCYVGYDRKGGDERCFSVLLKKHYGLSC